MKIKSRDKYKTGFVTLHSKYTYLQMSQGLKGALHTYFQFSDIVFGHLPKTASIPSQSSLIEIMMNGDFPFL